MAAGVPLILLSLALSAAVGSAGPQDSELPRGGESAVDLAYGPNPSQRLDICRPPGDAARHPALIMIHGGGWASGDKRAFAGLCRLAARRGIVGVTINYRLANGTEATRWPAQLEDVQSAVSWVRAHADALGIDRSRICALGASAGGHLAVFLAVLTDPPAARVACAIDEFGPVDLTRLHMPVIIARLLGPAAPDALRAREESASPLRLVSSHAAPILIVQGSRDSAVTPEQSEALYAALRRAGVPTRLLTYVGGHAFQALAPAERLAILEAGLDFVLAAPPRL